MDEFETRGNYKHILSLIKERVDFYLNENGMINEFIYTDYNISGYPKEVLDLIINDVKCVYKNLLIRYYYAGAHKSIGYDVDYYTIVFYLESELYGTNVIFESF